MLDRTDEQEIVDVVFLNPIQTPFIQDGKESIIDIGCRDQNDHECIVEMQVAPQGWLPKRVQYYMSKSYCIQLDRKGEYRDMKPVIFLGILNFKLTNSPDYLSTHRFQDTETQEHLFSDFQVRLIELPSFNKSESELETVTDQWIYFLKTSQEVEFIPELIREAAVKEAFEVLDQTQWSKDELALYELRRLAKMDLAAAAEETTTMSEEGKEEEKKKIAVNKRIV